MPKLTDQTLRVILAAVLSGGLSFIATATTLTSGLVTHEQMKEYAQKSTPYSYERGEILDKLDRSINALESVSDRLQAIDRRLAVVEERIDTMRRELKSLRGHSPQN